MRGSFDCLDEFITSTQVTISFWLTLQGAAAGTTAAAPDQNCGGYWQHTQHDGAHSWCGVLPRFDAFLALLVPASSLVACFLSFLDCFLVVLVSSTAGSGSDAASSLVDCFLSFLDCFLDCFLVSSAAGSGSGSDAASSLVACFLSFLSFLDCFLVVLVSSASGSGSDAASSLVDCFLSFLDCFLDCFLVSSAAGSGSLTFCFLALRGVSDSSRLRLPLLLATVGLASSSHTPVPSHH